MKFRVRSADLSDVLKVVTLVSPIVVTLKGLAGFLFVVEGDKCSIHSRDDQRRVKVTVPIQDVEGEGSFVYPADKINALNYLDGWIEFESGQDGDRYWVKYLSERGAKAEWGVCDPELLQPLDEDLAETSEGFQIPSAILREGLTMTKSYLAPSSDNQVGDEYKLVQLFDATKKEWAQGDGVLFASDHFRAIYFVCEQFKGKGLSIHAKHLPYVMSFLSKCEGNITIRQGENATFMVDAKKVLGWSHAVKQYGKYSYYPLKMDSFILSTPKAPFMQTLRLVRAELDPIKDKIRVEYENQSLQFKLVETSGHAESNPVNVTPVLDEEKGIGLAGPTGTFACSVNINHLIEIVEPIKETRVELRASVVNKNGRDIVLFRTIERFPMDVKGKILIDKNAKDSEEVFVCEVTRFMPSKV